MKFIIWLQKISKPFVNTFDTELLEYQFLIIPLVMLKHNISSFFTRRIDLSHPEEIKSFTFSTIFYSSLVSL